jgi:photosystem II stability/assembly factor-like uncharacterized protein
MTHNVLHNDIQSIKIHPTNSAIVLACTSNRLIKTTDSGASWYDVFTPGSLEIYDIQFSYSNPNIVLAAGAEGLFKSTDAGENWDTIFTQTCTTVERNLVLCSEKQWRQQ